MRARSQGLWLGPNNGLPVWKSAHSSGTLVLPRITAPAARSRATALASSRATLSLSGGWLEVVRSPRTSNASLIVIGTPCSGPRSRPAARARSAARAALSAPARSIATSALSGPFRRSMRARCACVASTEPSRPARMARASRVAVSKHGSIMPPLRPATLAAPRGRRYKPKLT